MDYNETYPPDFDPERTPVIEVRDLYKSFGPTEVLTGFNMDVYKGQNAVVMGRSGVGKSVLIKCIIGLLQPDSGTLNVFGQSVVDLNKKGMDWLRRRIGFCFQNNALYDSMTVRENLEFPLRRHYSKRELRPKIDAMVHQALESVGLEHTQDYLPSELSGGMKKRIALARTVILNPEIILYDEPTSGLDPITAMEISQLIVNIQEQRKSTSIVITHDIICARITASHMNILIDGINYATGTFDQLRNNGDQRVLDYFSQLED